MPDDYNELLQDIKVRICEAQNSPTDCWTNSQGHNLKMRAFEPVYAGKMNFYLSAVDDLLRHEGDAPTIGIILCKTKNDTAW